jgi:hypothetical protein
MAYTTVDNPELYFQTKLYTGNSGTNVITLDGSENMQPDWIWIKERGATGFHVLTDVVRGITKQLYSNDNQVENTNSFSITAIGSNGFTLGNRADVNNNSDTYVAWNWLAGGTASSNTDGSITSTVSANTTSGFSIVSYTGTGSVGTVGHGLGVAPAMIITKNRDSGGSGYWGVYHQSLGNGKALFLNRTDASGTNVAYWNNTSPTTSVFSLGDGSTSNVSSENHIAYCFAEKKGFSKFGSYVSNNNADGTFVYTGFKPAFLLLKNITTGSTGWEMYDNKRTPNNVANLFLRANTSDADVSSDRLDILSNGFKLRQVGDTNYNSDVIIYMAFAENPFVSSTGVPACAR